jgi:hypothetical protein
MVIKYITYQLLIKKLVKNNSFEILNNKHEFE